MGGGLEWAAKEDIRRRTQLVNKNLESWDQGDVYHAYCDFQNMFESLRAPDSVLTRKQMGLVDSAFVTFDKIFHMEKKG